MTPREGLVTIQTTDDRKPMDSTKIVMAMLTENPWLPRLVVIVMFAQVITTVVVAWELHMLVRVAADAKVLLGR